jgi:hypothetical protein
LLAVSQVIYVFVGGQLKGFRTSPTDPDFIRVTSVALGFVALIEAIGIIVLFRRGAILPIREGRLDPTSGVGIGRLLMVLIACWALAESIAIYGAVLQFLGSQVHCWTPFSVAGAVLLLAVRPWHRGLSRPPRSSDLAGSAEPIS